jgi:hypothetical protein
VSESLVSDLIARTDIAPLPWALGHFRTSAFGARQTCTSSSSSSSPISGRSTTRPSGATATCLACRRIRISMEANTRSHRQSTPSLSCAGSRSPPISSSGCPADTS